MPVNAYSLSIELSLQDKASKALDSVLDKVQKIQNGIEKGISEAFTKAGASASNLSDSINELQTSQIEKNQKLSKDADKILENLDSNTKAVKELIELQNKKNIKYEEEQKHLKQNSKLASAFGEMGAESISKFLGAATGLAALLVVFRIGFKDLAKIQEEFKDATFRSIGGVDDLADSVVSLKLQYGFTSEEATRAVKAIGNVALEARSNIDSFSKATISVAKFTRATGISESTTAEYVKQLERTGISLNQIDEYLGSVSSSMQMAGLSTEDATSLVQEFGKLGPLVAKAGDPTAMNRFQSATIKAAAAAKRLGINVSEVVSLMDGLTRNTMSYLVATGGATGSVEEMMAGIIENIGFTTEEWQDMDLLQRQILAGIKNMSQEQILAMTELRAEFEATGQTGREALLKFLEDHRAEQEKAAEMERQFQEANDNLNRSFMRLGQQFEGLIQIVTTLIEPIGWVIKGIADFIGEIAKTSKILAFAAAVTIVTTSFVLYRKIIKKVGKDTSEAIDKVAKGGKKGGIGRIFTSLGDGIAGFFKSVGKVKPSDLLKAGAALAILVGSIVALGFAIKGADLNQEKMIALGVGLVALSSSLLILSKIASKIDTAQVLKIAASIFLLSASLLPLSMALETAQTNWQGLFVLAAGLTILMIAGAIAGKLWPILLVGAVVIAALGAAMIPAAAAALMFGAAINLALSPIASIVESVVDGFKSFVNSLGDIVSYAPSLVGAGAALLVFAAEFSAAAFGITIALFLFPLGWFERFSSSLANMSQSINVLTKETDFAGIANIETFIRGLTDVDFDGLEDMADALEELEGVELKGLPGIVKFLKDLTTINVGTLNDSLKQLSRANWDVIENQIADAFEEFEGVELSGMGELLKFLKELPSLDASALKNTLNELDGADWGVIGTMGDEFDNFEGTPMKDLPKLFEFLSKIPELDASNIVKQLNKLNEADFDGLDDFVGSFEDFEDVPTDVLPKMTKMFSELADVGDAVTTLNNLPVEFMDNLIDSIIGRKDDIELAEETLSGFAEKLKMVSEFGEGAEIKISRPATQPISPAAIRRQSVKDAETRRRHDQLIAALEKINKSVEKVDVADGGAGIGEESSVILRQILEELKLGSSAGLASVVNQWT